MVRSQMPQSTHPTAKRKLEAAEIADDLIAMRARKLVVPEWGQSEIQILVRSLTVGKTLVLRAKRTDMVKTVCGMIEKRTRIPALEQRLIYGIKQLDADKTLAECGIENNYELKLIGKMRSTLYPKAWSAAYGIVHHVIGLLKNEVGAKYVDHELRFVRERFSKYVRDFPGWLKKVVDKKVKDLVKWKGVVEYLEIFMESGAYKALALLYLSVNRSYKECGNACIREIVGKLMELENKEHKTYGARIVLEFCWLLNNGASDGLYVYCRSSLGSMMLDVGFVELTGNDGFPYLIRLAGVLPFFMEAATRLVKNMDMWLERNGVFGSLAQDVADFSAFLHPLRNLISISQSAHRGELHPYGKEAKILSDAYCVLMPIMDRCLERIEIPMVTKGQEKGVTCATAWCSFFRILKELNSVAPLVEDDTGLFGAMMRNRRVSIEGLIIRYAKNIDDCRWLLCHKNVLRFASRRHLAMLIFPETQDWDEMHEMLIDRAQLLPESFAYVSQATPDSLRAGLFMEFKNEEATGPGVLREWFFLVCQALFNPQNALFCTCPQDQRRFFPSPASKVDPMHQQYFKFSGRVVALALMHKVQVGIVFDRIFFLQLAEEKVVLEDIKDADPYMYNSCKQILEMDAELVDSDVLGLTFVWEVDQLGSREVVELCPEGNSIAVNSNNREEYIRLLVKYRFVDSISVQVSEFATGFSDIVGSPEIRKTFFRSLDLEDMDSMLSGSGSAISVEDWKEHTSYNDYGEIDPQICWFWKIVREMSAEQRNVLLFFWTSIKYLPVDGFSGLVSRLCICKANKSTDSLPSSQTCFYRLCIPPYPSMDIMRKRLAFITQEHVGCSFGTW